MVDADDARVFFGEVDVSEFVDALAQIDIDIGETSCDFAILLCFGVSGLNRVARLAADGVESFCLIDEILSEFVVILTRVGLRGFLSFLLSVDVSGVLRLLLYGESDGRVCVFDLEIAISDDVGNLLVERGDILLQLSDGGLVREVFRPGA